MHFDSGGRHGSRLERRHRPVDGDRIGAVVGAVQATRAIWPSAYASLGVTPSREPRSYGVCLYRANDLRRHMVSDLLNLGV